MESVLVDTDVFSFLFKSDTRAASYKSLMRGSRTCLSFMSVAELHRWALAHNWSDTRRQSLLDAMCQNLILPYDPSLAEIWARITVQRSRAGRPIECGDCWIAATAIRYKLPLVTHNAADFAHIDALRIVTAA